MTAATPSPWLTRTEVADRLRMSPYTLEKWAAKGIGPRFAKFGKHARYRLSDVTDWEEQQFDGRAVAS